MSNQKINNIVVLGDSWAEGWGFHNDFLDINISFEEFYDKNSQFTHMREHSSFGGLVAKNLGIKNINNFASGGFSNFQIMDSLLSTIRNFNNEDMKNTFFLISLSCWQRMTFPLSENSIFYIKNPNDFKNTRLYNFDYTLAIENCSKAKNFVKNVLVPNFYDDFGLIEISQRYITSMYEILKKSNSKFLFIDTFAKNFIEKDYPKRKRNKISQQIQMFGEYISESPNYFSNKLMGEYCLEKFIKNYQRKDYFYCEILDYSFHPKFKDYFYECAHPNRKSHKIIADVLTEYIENEKILK